MTLTADAGFVWGGQDLESFLPLMLAIVCFTAYWFISKSYQLKSWFHNRFGSDTGPVYHITFNRVAGFLLMGMVPLVVSLLFLSGKAPGDYGLRFDRDTRLYSLMWTAILTLLVVPAAFFSARKPANLVNYPQIRARVWTRSTVIINIAGWALYLFGYELLFRGVLLFPLAAVIGVWPAIAVNIALYSATHIPKGLAETVGAAPLGLVLCVLTLNSGTIWIAFLVHLFMALTNSFTALKYNTEMVYRGRQR